MIALNSHKVLVFSIFSALMMTTSSANAHIMFWTDWTSLTNSPTGAIGNLNGITVTYTGEVYLGGTPLLGHGTDINGGFKSPATEGFPGSPHPIGWDPAPTYTVVINGESLATPASVGDIIALTGASPNENTLTFSVNGIPVAIENPYIAIYSLGNTTGGDHPASFSFFDSVGTPLDPTFIVGGPNSGYGGSAISVSGNTVSGLEGNGVIQFHGFFHEIQFTSTSERYYGFTVGSVPEPSSIALISLGYAVLGFSKRRKLTA